MQTYVKEAGWIGIGGEVISHPNSSNSGVHNPERVTACTRVTAFSPTSLF